MIKKNWYLQGLAGMVLWGFQYGLLKEIFEGQSTIPGKANGEGPFEKTWFSSGIQFREVGFFQKWKQGIFNLTRSDLVPGNDAMGVLFYH